jgi:chitinase
MYGADNGLSPSDIEKYDISSGVANLAYDSPYHGDYAMCGNLWISENGVHIYTACGNTFRSSSIQNQDMLYNGALQLRSSIYSSNRIVSLSQSAEQQEIMLVEADQYCETWNSASGCNRYLNLYESLYLNRTATFIIPDMTVNTQSYRQFPMFVFHSADGTKRYLISKLDAMPNPDAEYYWTELQ